MTPTNPGAPDESKGTRHNPVRVKHVWEQHTFLAEQRCSCGERYRVTRFDLHPEGLAELEVARVACESCGTHRDLWFDVTLAFEGYQRGGDPVTAGWSERVSGPYAIKADEYRRRAEAILSALKEGTISEQEYRARLEQLLDETYPRIAGKYRVLGERKGSMGVAYLTSDALSPDFRLVVCKTIDTSLDPALSDALRREATVWMELGDHANVVRLLDVVAPSPSRLILVIEAVPAGPSARISVRDWLDARAVALPLALRFFQQLCAALLHCQARLPGFVHGDLKPENLLVGVGLVLKVTDFGLARAAGLTGPRLGESAGTPLFLAPECWQGAGPTEKSDVYAAGLIMYEMLSGRHPFGGAKTKEELRWLHLQGTVEPLGPEVPESVSQLVLECLVKNPVSRPNFVDLATRIGTAWLPPSAPELGESGRSPAEWNNRGKALLEMQRYREAIDCFVNALKDEPENPSAWNNLAVAFSRLGNVDHAERSYRACIDLGDAPAQAYANYSAHIIRQGNVARYEEAIAYCDRALDGEPGNVFALINKGQLLRGLRRHGEAVEVAELATRADPGNAVAWVGLGWAYWEIGRKSKARECSKKALNLDPAFIEAQTLKRMLDLERGK